ncbi:hypothetical protein ROZALSC1DRAFT_21603 [Rozella allomycis CSF55]|uniref:Uncharacterized protein n=1 Tax=Rozella allomycis (strain CSF55) TaxID=988480 RepID=A0A4P9YLZ3_ROZAC|nr:hypothetical protein ROZALSC1DRAFT_21603 [Rozella allomycis CSF55]
MKVHHLFDFSAKHSEDAKEMKNMSYCECVGRLANLLRITIPDSAYGHNPARVYYNAVKTIMKYLRDTMALALQLRSNRLFGLTSITNAYEEDIMTMQINLRKSLEFCALTHILALIKNIWIRELLSPCNIKPDNPTPILSDNGVAIKIAENHMITPRNFIQDKQIHIKIIPGKDNITASRFRESNSKVFGKN